MRIVLKALFVNILSILIFSIIYINIAKDNFLTQKNTLPEYIDCLLECITIQAGVGISSINPVTNLGKSVVMIQQLLLICTNAITLYLFVTL